MRQRLPASIRYWQYLFLVERDGGPRCAICGRDESETYLEIDHINGDPGDNSPSNLRLLCRSCNRREFHRRMKERLSTQPPPLPLVHEVLQKIALDRDAKEREKMLKGGGEGNGEKGLEMGLEMGEKTEDPPTSFSSFLSHLRVADAKSSVCESERENGGAVGGEGKRIERALSVEAESPEIRIARAKEPLFRAKCIELCLRPGGLTVYDAINEVAEIVGISPVTARRYLAKLTSPAGPLKIGEGPRGHQLILLREEYWEQLGSGSG